MSENKVRLRRFIELALFLLFFAGTVAINLRCQKSESNPAAGPECGSGHVTWDAKAQVCRDQANNRIVPSNCCGR
jgi:hypothetical protein